MSVITRAAKLGYFRADCRTGIVANASRTGLGVVLAQEQGYKGVQSCAQGLARQRSQIGT